MKWIVYMLAFCLSFFLISCDDEVYPTMDRLEDAGILGEWKLDSRVVNNIGDLSIMCCDYLVFSTSGSPDDLRGNYTARGSGYENSGEFVCTEALDSLTTVRDNQIRTYGLNIEAERLTFSYIEEGDEIVEYWVKVP